MMHDTPPEPECIRIQIVDFTCGHCNETQRRVILDPNGTRCTKCRRILRFTDGILRPGLARAYPREEP